MAPLVSLVDISPVRNSEKIEIHFDRRPLLPVPRAPGFAEVQTYPFVVPLRSIIVRPPADGIIKPLHTTRTSLTMEVPPLPENEAGVAYQFIFLQGVGPVSVLMVPHVYMNPAEAAFPYYETIVDICEKSQKLAYYIGFAPSERDPPHPLAPHVVQVVGKPKARNDNKPARGTEKPPRKGHRLLPRLFRRKPETTQDVGAPNTAPKP